MAIKFTKINMPIDILRTKFDEITSDSKGDVTFQYIQNNTRKNSIISDEQYLVSYSIYVKNDNNDNFRLHLFDINYGLKPYPAKFVLYANVMPEIKRDVHIGTALVTFESEDDIIKYYNKLIEDSNFLSTLNSIYNI